ncbi:MAG: phage tail tape measure protein, partial [Candidatus Cloacimonetes bacterium]|nr:phage tail tape measure protein [Candidatus Cloacimonadota bacterium]
MQDRLGLLIDVLIKSGNEQKMQTELDKMAKKLKLDIDTNVKTDRFKNYEKAIDKIIHKYKLKDMSDEQFIKAGEKIRQSVHFQNLEWSKQEKIISTLIAADKSHTSAATTEAKQRIENIQKEQKAYEKLELFKQKMQLESKKMLGSTYSDKVNTDELNKLNEEIQSLSITTPNLDQKMKQFNLRMKEVNTDAKSTANALKNVNHDGLSMIEMLGIAAKKFIIWQIAVGGVMKAVREFREALEDLKNIDTLLVSVAKVTGMAKLEMQELVKYSIQASKEFGRTAQEFLTSVRDFSRAGFGDLASDMARLSMLAQNVGDITADMANEMLLAVDAGYQLGGSQEKLLHVLDALNEVANRNPTDIAKMSEGIKVAASIFQQAGFEIEEFISLIGTATSVTQRSGTEIARGLRTTVMNLQGVTSEIDDVTETTISKAEKALNSIGVAVRATETEFRKPMDVLKDLAYAYKDLTDVERSYVTESLANKRQANILVGVLQNWEMVEKQLAEAINSTGSAMTENEIYMKSWEALAAQNKTAWTDFWNTVINTDVIKFLITVSTKFAEFAKTLAENKIVISVVAGLLAGILVIAIKAVGVALKGLIVKLGTINILTFGLPALIGLIVTALTGLGLAVSSTSDNLKNLNEESLKLLKTQNEEITMVDKLVKRYDELQSKTELTAEEQQELYNIQSKLATIYPETANGIGLEKEKITDQIGLVKQLNNEKKKGYEDDIKRLAQKGKIEMQGLISERDRLETEKNRLDSQIKTHENFVSKYSNLYQKAMREAMGDGISETTLEEVMSIRDDRYSFNNLPGFISTIEKEMEAWEKTAVKVADVNDKLKENKDLRYQYAEAIVELDKLQNPQNYTTPPFDIEDP